MFAIRAWIYSTVNVFSYNREVGMSAHLSSVPSCQFSPQGQRNSEISKAHEMAEEVSHSGRSFTSYVIMYTANVTSLQEAPQIVFPASHLVSHIIRRANPNSTRNASKVQYSDTSKATSYHELYSVAQ